MNDERRKVLTEYLGEPETTSEYTVANSGDWVSVRTVRTVIQKRTFDTDADMMALFRRIYYNAHWDRFVWWLKDNPHYDATILEVFLETEKFCFLVSEWLRKEKI